MKQMVEALNVKKYERRITPVERMFSKSPYSIVTVVARIKGEVTEETVTNAVKKVQLRHANLQVRIKEDENHNPWFTTEGVKEIPISVVPRESNDHWMEVFHEQCNIPFDFEIRPPIRFILVQSPQISELIIFCHHIICDGMSLAYLARDIMVHLGDPTKEVKILPDPVIIDRDTLPEDLSINAIVKYVVNRMNKKWKKEEIYFDQKDYLALNEAYWKRYKHSMFSIEFSEDQTTALVERCRKEKVTVNTALTTAIVAAQNIVQGEQPYHSSVGVAVSLRKRLQKPAGEGMGFYAGVVILKYKYNRKKTFWDNVRKVHGKIKSLAASKKIYGDFLMWNYIEPAILETRNFKVLGKFVDTESARYEKISNFNKRDDMVLSLLKRENLHSLDNFYMGSAVTNLTKLDFPKKYGTLELDRLIMNPGGAFPIVNINVVLGAVTCAGKLSILLEYAEERIDTQTMEKIKEKMKSFLLSEK